MNMKEKLQEKSKGASVANRKLRNDQFEEFIEVIEEILNKAADRCQYYVTLRTEISLDNVKVIKLQRVNKASVACEYGVVKCYLEDRGLKVESKADLVTIMWGR